jgi:hypothetical protein
MLETIIVLVSIPAYLLLIQEIRKTSKIRASLDRDINNNRHQSTDNSHMPSTRNHTPVHSAKATQERPRR